MNQHPKPAPITSLFERIHKRVTLLKKEIDDPTRQSHLSFPFVVNAPVVSEFAVTSTVIS